jgi:hypothetical protein
VAASAALHHPNALLLPIAEVMAHLACSEDFSLSDDIAALNVVLERTEGPVLRAGHAYAGAVIAAASDEKVRSLVYVAALAPDEGETVAEVSL